MPENGGRLRYLIRWDLLLFTSHASLHYQLLYLVDHFVNPHLNLLLLLFKFLRLPVSLIPPFRKISSAKRPPCVPLIHQSFTVGDEFRADITLFCCVLLVKCTTVFAEVLLDLLLLLFAQQSARTWTPNKLFEAILNKLDELLSTEVPNSITIFELKLLS